MVPNKYGLIRQKDLNLLAIPFLGLLDNFSEYEIEVVNNPEETYPNETYKVEGNRESRNGFTSFLYDISKYDYVLICVSGSVATHTYSGLSISPTETFSKLLHITQRGIAFELISTTEGVETPYAKISLRNDTLDQAVILGFKKHRNDNVNPRNIRTMQDVELEQKKRK